MSIFFTVLGLSSSFKLIKKGGKLLFTYWILCGGLALFQNIISVVMAKITNVHPLIEDLCVEQYLWKVAMEMLQLSEETLNVWV